MQRRMSTIREYKFFRSFSAKVDNWPIRKAEAIWRKMRERKIAEIEAIEACKWLRAAGFPQYAQMYEDLQFPIDLSNVAKDHPFLENDPLQSLYRRLVALNRCAAMRLDGTHNKHGNNDDSDDDSCALSENWTFQPQSRRWSRVGEMELPAPPAKGDKNKDKLNISSRESSPESTDAFDYVGLPHGGGSDQEMIQSKFRRTGSERLRDGAKAFLRRVESIKSKRRKRQNREGVIISGPQVLDFGQMNQKMSDLKCVDVFSHPCSPVPTSPTIMSPKHLFVNNNELRLPFTDPNRLSPKHIVGKKPHHYRSLSNRTSPLHFMGQTSSKSGDDSSSYCSDTNSQDSGTIRVGRKKPNRARRFFQRGSKVEDAGALSDSECHPGKNKYFKDTSGKEVKTSKLARGGSLNLGKESDKYRDAFQKRSLRSRSTIRKHDRRTDSDSKDEDVILRSNRGPVVRWHSFQTADKPEMKLPRPLSAQPSKKKDSGVQFAALSCGQFQVIRKLALVTLTGYMERYCPTHRSGWNWELPKFIKKIKTPDYKDKKVFGVPLLLVLQRTGHTLPTSIQQALKWLKANALDQVGLFRKSGVKSRIFKIKGMVEGAKETELVTLFDGQQAYDVADMVKQYFRELPESLLTSKMSETFIAIFQHLPPEVRLDAVQSAVLLLPDENREVLYTLIVFLNQVSECSMFNQMTANNLAVCLAPSIFHGGIISPRSNSVSPRRRKPTGLPDPRELCETKASHECLTFLIQNYRSVFMIPNEKMQRCKFSHLDESRPVTLDTLGEDIQLHDWRGYLYECTTAAIKEGREKSRGWISSPSLDSHVDISYKKIGDGHPLRLWKCVVEVEAPPMEVLHHIVKERQLWDTDLLKWRIIEQLDEKSEIFQYVCGGQSITDYCVLRSWNTELPRGACVIVETSIDHPDATLLLLGGVRGVVLASRYLIEPCGSGKSRIVHLARVDAKGRTPEWYNKSYGHICSHYLSAIRNFFKHVTQGPESKV
ncbi:rho GTPase-activating protein 7 isoform X3 [Phlebotomus papatasi]|uniref:rho GTPase-activating protein 7 isoform X3 n=1 Tax=Phlebotomus papatasi TaxID=29031 RepID=UPI002483E238|nr:rho GTPase-activating protein 7 isoform X3 [Phlebotomus papatasi]